MGPTHFREKEVFSGAELLESFTPGDRYLHTDQ